MRITIVLSKNTFSMARERDVWDKLNRQKKVLRPSRVARGPAPVGPFLERIRQKHEVQKRVAEEQRRLADQQRLESLALLAKAEWRQFSISPLIMPLLIAHGVNTKAIVDATKAVLVAEPLPISSKPVKFWLYNRKVERRQNEARELGLPFELVALPHKLLPWILKFKPRTPPELNSR